MTEEFYKNLIGKFKNSPEVIFIKHTDFMNFDNKCNAAAINALANSKGCRATLFLTATKLQLDELFSDPDNSERIEELELDSYFENIEEYEDEDEEEDYILQAYILEPLS